MQIFGKELGVLGDADKAEATGCTLRESHDIVMVAVAPYAHRGKYIQDAWDVTREVHSHCLTGGHVAALQLRHNVARSNTARNKGVKGSVVVGGNVPGNVPSGAGERVATGGNVGRGSRLHTTRHRNRSHNKACIHNRE